jgi:predicted RNA-binding Zn-ribbon protein involved in translation (DUF1610 family)
MTIDGISVHQSITADRILEAVKASKATLDDPGFCICCGAEALGVEPDARRYECESCGESSIYGAEELLLSI